MTRRDLQIGRARATQRPWDLGKDFEQSAVLAEIVPASDIGHPRSGRIELRVNGETKQASDLSLLIHGVPEWSLTSRPFYHLQPGDLDLHGHAGGRRTGEAGRRDRRLNRRLSAPSRSGLARRSDVKEEQMLEGCVPWPADFARRYVEAGLWEGITVAEMVERTARRQPQKIAVVYGDTRMTLRRADSVGQEPSRADCCGLGLQPQDRAVVQLPNSPEFVSPLPRAELHRCHSGDGAARPSPRRDPAFRPVLRRRRVLRCRPRRRLRLSADGRRDRRRVPIPATRRRRWRSRSGTRRRSRR